MDKEIKYKYINKNNFVLIWNYYTFLIFMAAWTASFFFINSPIILMILWAFMCSFYYILYKMKNRTIITSITVYKFSDIFTEILKSYKPSKALMTNLKWKLFKTKKKKKIIKTK